MQKEIWMKSWDVYNILVNENEFMPHLELNQCKYGDIYYFSFGRRYNKFETWSNGYQHFIGDYLLLIESPMDKIEDKWTVTMEDMKGNKTFKYFTNDDTEAMLDYVLKVHDDYMNRVR